MLMKEQRAVEVEVIACNSCGRTRSIASLQSALETAEQYKKWYSDGSVDLCEHCVKSAVEAWLLRSPELRESKNA